MAPVVDDATRFKAWLTEGMGGMSAPADAVAAELQTLWDDGEISASDMPVMDHALTKDELREIWSAIWTAVDEALVSKGVAAMSAIRKQEAITWAYPVY